MTSYFAVMGNPIAHSLSPFIHQQFAKQTQISIHYEKKLIPIEDKIFEAEVSTFFAQGGKGLNITLPFKERAFALAVVKTARCQEAKAANTLWWEKGQLHADNTDGIGLIRDLSRYLTLENKRALLLGAGGAARGIITPLQQAGLTLDLANRTFDKALILKRDFPKIKVLSLNDLESSDYDLIINATSTSLTTPSPQFPISLLKSKPFCYDLAYNAQNSTPFVKWAEEQGCEARDGLGMLVEQAAEAFAVWNGVLPGTENVLKQLKS